MKLSNESPVGKALLGRKRGDDVTIVTPRGQRQLTITKIDVGALSSARVPGVPRPGRRPLKPAASAFGDGGVRGVPC